MKKLNGFLQFVKINKDALHFVLFAFWASILSFVFAAVLFKEILK